MELQHKSPVSRPIEVCEATVTVLVQYIEGPGAKAVKIDPTLRKRRERFFTATIQMYVQRLGAT